METDTYKPQCPLSRPQNLTNFESQNEVTDVLHMKSEEVGVCSETVCNASLMNIRRISLQDRSNTEILSQAKQFLEEYYKHNKGLDSVEHIERLQEVTASVKKTGTYHLTNDELQYGAKLAWRNAPRCIGRISWNKLHLIDGRHVKTAKEMFDIMLEHLEHATNGGNLRSTITVFPQRKSGQRDFRVWNPQLLSYAGYEQPDGSVIGDPAFVEFTKVCEKLGWKGKGGRFDFLPWVVSTPTGQPEWFQVPQEKILTVPLTHPEYDWFKDLELEWFAVPAVSSMMFDCGGIQFPAAPFNGWYMAPEIGTRDLCDVQRYNMLPVFGEKLGLDTRSSTSLWKDKATLEVNIAVLHSFKEKGVTIVDHHTAAETFMQFHANEYRQRGGCPADWAWIVPPIGGSLTPVFHQEMSLYYLKPAYEYQIPAWIAFEKQNKMLSAENTSGTDKPIKKFKKAVLPVLFASTLYCSILSRRVRVAIIYASETGKAQAYANKLAHIFSHNFNPQVFCMADYDISKLSSETLVAFVTSTTGVGEPPVNGQEFVNNLYELREKAVSDGSLEKRMLFWEDYNEFKENGGMEVTSEVTRENKLMGRSNRGFFSRLIRRFRRRREYDIGRSSFDLSINSGSMYQSTSRLYKSSYNLSRSTSSLFKSLDPASDVMYAVFALGSTNYKHFCAFGKYIDNMMCTLGGERILELACGDETENQQESFNAWSSHFLKVCCERFHIEDSSTEILRTDQITSGEQVRLVGHPDPQHVAQGLSDVHGKNIISCKVVKNKTLFQKGEKWYQQIVIRRDLDALSWAYEPGDHIGVLPANNHVMINGILTHLKNLASVDSPVQVMIKRQIGSESWTPHPYLPVASVRILMSRYLDINATPSQTLIQLLADAASNSKHALRLSTLASNADEYRQWKNQTHPNLVEVLKEFGSVRIDVGLLLCHLPLLQPRLYSISSSPQENPNQLTLTVASFTYKTQGSKGLLRQGVCTSYLKSLRPGETIEIFHRSAPNFHLPESNEKSVPLLLIGSGSGVAPLRGFWQHSMLTGSFWDMTLYYGCQIQASNLYADEKKALLNGNVLTNTYLALSNEPTEPKTYVQDLLLVNGKEVYDQLVQRGGHVYICGSEGMADGVQKSLLSILQDFGGNTFDQAQQIIQKMKEDHRYHQDVFENGALADNL